MSTVTATTGCRSCGAPDLAEICDLGNQPPANALPLSPDTELDRHPLTVVMCARCGLAQLTVSVDPGELFSDYAYHSSYSPSVGASAAALVHRLVSERRLGPGDLAMEAASNDGYLLRHYVQAGIPVLGVDPAANIAEVAEADGVPTVVDFFGVDVARRLRDAGHRATVFHANNVLAHVPDLNGFVAGIPIVLADDGRAVIETPYLKELVERLEYDTIYHEHLCYYSLTSLDALFQRHGLSIVDVERIPLHGGSLRLFVAHHGAAARTDSVHAMLDEEQDTGMGTVEYFRDFGSRVAALQTRQRAVLCDLVSSGATVAGYGAAAKATVTLNALGLGADTVAFVVDRSPHKQGRFIAGTDIPVLPVDALTDRRPDYTVIFAWNFADEIIRQCAAYRSAGGRFIVPVPDVAIVG